MDDRNPLVAPRWCAAIGAWLTAALMLEIWVVLLAVLPARTNLSIDTLDVIYVDPAAFFTFLRDHPLVWRCLEPDLGMAVAIFLATWGLASFLREQSPSLSQLGLLAGTIASGLFLFAGMLETVGLPAVARLFQQHPEPATGAFQALQSALTASGWGAIFALGWSNVLLHAAGIRSRQLPRGLCYVSVLAGVTGILLFAFESLGLLGVAINIIANVWRGIVLALYVPSARPMAPPIAEARNV